MEQLIRFINEWWLFLAIGGGAILFIVILAAIVGRVGRKPVRRPALKPVADAVQDVHEEPEPIDLVPAEELPAQTLDPTPALDPVMPEPTPVSPIVEPAPIPAVPAADPTPDPVLVAIPASPLVSDRIENPAPASPSADPAVSEPVEPVRPKEPKPELGCYRVTYRAEDGKWLVGRDGSPRIMRTLETQTDAVNWATIKALTQNVELVIHKKDGSVKNPPTPRTKKAD